MGIGPAGPNKLAGANADKALLKMGVPKEHIPNSVSALRQFTTAAENGLPWERAAKNAQNASIGLRGIDKDALVKAMQEYAENRKGAMYEVSLRWPDAAREVADPLGPQHFLDWDKPLSQQPESVRKAIPAPKDKEALRKQYERTVKQMEGLPPVSEKFEKLHNKATQLSREMDYASKMQSATGADLYNLMGGGIIRQDVASQKLRDLGIPGIRYLDGMSRGAGEGTANYVVFDDAIAQILKRNGLMP